MKIQLIHPPFSQAVEDRLDPPLGLLSLASCLKHFDGHEVVVTDLTGGRSLEIEEDADIYGLTSYICTLDASAKIARQCKEANPSAKVITGGAAVTGLIDSGQYHAEEVKDFFAAFDSIIVGPGELAILDVVRDYPNLKPVYKHDLSRNLDLLPWPDYGYIDLDTYNRKLENEKTLSLTTSYGCVYRCAFCGSGNKRYVPAFRSPRSIVQEIKHLKLTHSITSFNFHDDTFLLDRERIQELCRLIKPLNITFKCHGRMGRDVKADYEMLQDAGCVALAWGVESGSDEILDRMMKVATTRLTLTTIGWAKELGILDRVFLLTGFPGETEKTLEETKQFLEELDPSQYFVSSFQPYPGTATFNFPDFYGITRIYKDYAKYIQIRGLNEGGPCNVDTKWTTRQQMERLDKEFRAWISARKRRGGLQEYEKTLESASKSVDNQPSNEG